MNLNRTYLFRILEAVHSACDIDIMYVYLVQDFGNTEALSNIAWSVTPLHLEKYWGVEQSHRSLPVS